jgi:hypothetical protein
LLATGVAAPPSRRGRQRAGAARLAVRGILPDGPNARLGIAAYGFCRAFGVSGTDGVRLEFFESAAAEHADPDEGHHQERDEADADGDASPA